MPIAWHVSISHPPAERERALRLAERLLAVGVAVALDEWSASDGGSGSSSSGRTRGQPAGSWSEVLWVAPASLVEPWSARLAHRLLAGAVAGRRRLVPLVVGAVDELPAPLAARPWADFRDDPSFASPARLWTLVAMLRGERADSPPPADWPEAFDDASGSFAAAQTRVGVELAAARARVSFAGREEVVELAGDEAIDVATALGSGPAGELLGRAFAAAPAAPRLELSIAHERWRAVPWETALPRALVEARLASAEPLPRVVRVQPTRAVVSSGGGAAPLGVLVVLSSPESRHGAGARVDAAAASRLALAAIEPACGGAPIRVEVRERAVPSEIARVVTEMRPQVVLLVAASRQGQLLLHRDDDREERVSAARLVSEALGDGADAPLVIVAEAPSADGAPSPREADGELAGFAHDLVEAGVAAALAVPDLARSAPALASALERLARGGATIVDSVATGAPSPGLLLVASPLVRPAVAAEASRARAAAPATISPTREPDLIGRRAELRALAKTLLGGERVGAWVVAPGGTGKSALVRELARRLDDARRVVVEVSGEVVPEDVVEAIGQRLEEHLRHSYERDDPEAEGREPLTSLATFLMRPEVAWRERWERLTRESAGRLTALVILDGFEANQEETGEVRDASLRELLTSWPREAGAPRLVITSRRAPPAAVVAGGRLEVMELAPLDPSGARWLRLALPHLVSLEPAFAARALESAAGSARSLVVLDRVVARAGSDGLSAVLGVASGSIVPKALAVLIEGLGHALAARLLGGALAYRVAVDALGMGWSVGAPVETAVDAARRERLARFQEAIQVVRARGEEPTIASLGLSRDDQRVLEADIAARLEPPVALPEELDAALDELVAATLLERRTGAEGALYRVPRWIREELVARAGAQGMAAAHRHAARYWHWRIKTLPRPAHADLADTIELHHHLVCAGEARAAREIAQVACAHLDAMGAIERVERFCHGALAGLAPESPEALPFEHQLAIAARKRGRISEARARVSRAAAIEEERGERRSLLASWGELGILAAIDGDLVAANGWFQKARAAAAELGDVDAEAASLHHLALLSRGRGALDEARERAERALALRERARSDGDLGAVLLTLGEVEGARRSFDAAAAALSRALVLARASGDAARALRVNLALAVVARDRDQPEEATRLLRWALDDASARGDRSAAAEAASELARLAERKGAIEEAWASFRRALEISERDGDRDAMIVAYLDLARVDQRRGHSIDALGWAVHAVAAALTTGSPLSREALEVLALQARVLGGGKRWRSSWRRAFDTDPPPEVVAWVEASWLKRVQRRRRA